MASERDEDPPIAVQHDQHRAYDERPPCAARVMRRHQDGECAEDQQHIVVVPRNRRNGERRRGENRKPQPGIDSPWSGRWHRQDDRRADRQDERGQRELDA